MLCRSVPDKVSVVVAAHASDTVRSNNDRIREMEAENSAISQAMLYKITTTFSHAKNGRYDYARMIETIIAAKSFAEGMERGRTMDIA